MEERKVSFKYKKELRGTILQSVYQILPYLMFSWIVFPLAVIFHIIVSVGGVYRVVMVRFAEIH